MDLGKSRTASDVSSCIYWFHHITHKIISLSGNCCSIVTRQKSNTKLDVLKRRPVSKLQGMTCGMIGNTDCFYLIRLNKVCRRNGLWSGNFLKKFIISIIILMPIYANADIKFMFKAQSATVFSGDWFVSEEEAIQHRIRNFTCSNEQDVPVVTYHSEVTDLGTGVNQWTGWTQRRYDVGCPGHSTSSISVTEYFCIGADTYWDNALYQCRPGADPDPSPYEYLESLPNLLALANLGKCPCPPNSTNPINPSTGNKYQIETDYLSSQSNGLRYERYYNSGTEVRPGLHGPHWRSTYDRTIVPSFDTDTLEIFILAYRPDGQGITFQDVSGVWTPIVDLETTLTQLTDGQGTHTGWTLTDGNDTVETYDAQGRLLSITNRAGFTQTLDYELTVAEGGDDDPATLDRVTGPFGRTLTFAYLASGKLDTLTDPGGHVFDYRYNSSGSLARLIYPDDTPGTTADNPRRKYVYTDPNFPRALTGIEGEDGQAEQGSGTRIASWTYDAEGRATSSEHGATGSGIDKVDVVYNTDGTTTLTNTLGQVRTYHFETHNYVHKTAQVDGEQCVRCGSLTDDITYDANGFVASKTDYNGNTTTYVHDATGLQLSRTEAAGTPEARTITTTWDATFRVPLTLTEPGRVTTFTYDAQGRQLTRTQEATP